MERKGTVMILALPGKHNKIYRPGDVVTSSQVDDFDKKVKNKSIKIGESDLKKYKLQGDLKVTEEDSKQLELRISNCNKRVEGLKAEGAEGDPVEVAETELKKAEEAKKAADENIKSLKAELEKLK
jgi:chromosome segregation ATPase